LELNKNNVGFNCSPHSKQITIVAIDQREMFLVVSDGLIVNIYSMKGKGKCKNEIKNTNNVTTIGIDQI